MPIPRRDSITCERCGVLDLQWLRTMHGWWLFTQAGKWHSCAKGDIETETRRKEEKDAAIQLALHQL